MSGKNTRASEKEKEKDRKDKDRDGSRDRSVSPALSDRSTTSSHPRSASSSQSSAKQGGATPIDASGIKKWGEKIVQKNQSLEKEIKDKSAKLKEKEREAKEREAILQQREQEFKKREEQMKQEFLQLQQEKDAAISRARAEAERADIERQRADDEQDRANEEARRAAEAAGRQNSDDSDSESEMPNSIIGDTTSSNNTQNQNFELAQLIKSLGSTVETISSSMQASMLSVGKAVGESILETMGEPAAKKRKMDEASASEFVNNDRSVKVIPQYSGMSFEGMIAHLKLKPCHINKIMRDEFIELGSLYSESENSTYHRSEENDNNGQKVVPPTKPEFFECLYLFGMYYLQKYPHKTASFLGYLYYLSKQSAKLNIQGLVRLDADLRKQYTNNTEWLWTQDKFTIMTAADEVKDKLEFRNFKGAFRQGFNPNPMFKPKFAQKGGRPSVFKPKQQQRRELSQERIDQLKSERCGKWNSGVCTRRDCLRQHNCWNCGGAHKKSTCPNPPPKN